MSKAKEKPAVGADPDIAKIRQVARSRVRALAAAVKLEETPNYTLDTVYASSVAVNSARRAAQLGALLSKLVTFDYQSVELLDLLGQALMDIQGEINNCSKVEAAMTVHANEGYGVRSLLLGYADLLVMVGGADAATVAKIREGAGYKDLVEDLESLHKLYGDRLLPADGPVTKKTVARAAELSVVLGKDITSKDESEASHNELLAERRRIAYLLHKTHHEVRRAILFLRDAEGDVDEIIPSLHATGVARSSKEKSTDDTSPEQGQPTQARPEQTQPGNTQPTQTKPAQVNQVSNAKDSPVVKAGFVGNPNDCPFDDRP